MNIPNTPVKGTADWFPEEFAVRKYIFDTWRKVCLQFGYQEYLTPLVELADTYRAKSGEDAGGKELTVFEDRGGRELAIRPEMTPSVTRMVSRRYESTAKPIRLFSIANFFRNENPQRGRNREFWQLNADIFGSNSIVADVEVLQMAIEIMLAFGATKEQFKLHLNDRQLIEVFVTKYLNIDTANISEATRVLDKLGKIADDELINRLKELGAEIKDASELIGFLNSDPAALQNVNLKYLTGQPGLARLEQITECLNQMGYAEYWTYAPGLMRGFDYYDGMIFELFDLHPDNRKALFGGGRYNGLAGIFGAATFPAVGFAPGDETTRLFLESWNLVPSTLQIRTASYLPLLDATLEVDILKLAAKLRQDGKSVIVGTEPQGLGKALDYANKQQLAEVVILGTSELERGVYVVKNLQSSEQVEYKL
jgi:histidyl-tRNA synthetase